MAAECAGDGGLKETLEAMGLLALYQFSGKGLDDGGTALVEEFSQHFCPATRWTVVRGRAIHMVPELFSETLDISNEGFSPRLSYRWQRVPSSMDELFVFLYRFLFGVENSGSGYLEAHEDILSAVNTAMTGAVVNWSKLLTENTVRLVGCKDMDRLVLLGHVLRVQISAKLPVPEQVALPVSASMLTGQTRSYYDNWQHSFERSLKRAYQIVASLEQELNKHGKKRFVDRKRRRLQAEQQPDVKVEDILDEAQKLREKMEAADKAFKDEIASLTAQKAELRVQLKNSNELVGKLQLEIDEREASEEADPILIEMLRSEVHKLKVEARTAKQVVKRLEAEGEASNAEVSKLKTIAGNYAAQLQRDRMKAQMIVEEREAQEAAKPKAVAENPQKTTGDAQAQASRRGQKAAMRLQPGTDTLEVVTRKEAEHRLCVHTIKELKAAKQELQNRLQNKVTTLQVAEQVIFKTTCKLETQEYEITDLRKQLEESRSRNVKLEQEHDEMITKLSELLNSVRKIAPGL